jgi:hypothetical protein
MRILCVMPHVRLLMGSSPQVSAALASICAKPSPSYDPHTLQRAYMHNVASFGAAAARSTMRLA